MISQASKKKLLEELERTGNVQYSCSKAGVSRASYYVWLEQDIYFKTKAANAIRLGRESTVEKVEQVLVNLALVDKNLGAIKCYLANNSPRYNPRQNIINEESGPSKVIIEIVKNKEDIAVAQPAAESIDDPKNNTEPI